MTYSYTKAWRRRTKQKLVAALGGKCQICGYNKSPAGLSCHHLDPQKKDFTISEACSGGKWLKIQNEAKKCVLLCRNCHAELHAGDVVLPRSYQKFDPALIPKHLILSRTKEDRICEFCGKIYKTYNNSTSRYCGYDCVFEGKKKVTDHDLMESYLKTGNLTKSLKALGLSLSGKNYKRIKILAGLV